MLAKNWTMYSLTTLNICNFNKENLNSTSGHLL